MTTERIKSISILAATLLIGVLLGLLVPGIFHKVSRRHGDAGGPGRRGHEIQRKGAWLQATISHVIQPDTLQKNKIEPVLSWASERLDAIEQHANQDASGVLDSVKIKLRPLINDDQWKRLEKFDQQAKSRWYRHEPRH